MHKHRVIHKKLPHVRRHRPFHHRVRKGLLTFFGFVQESLNSFTVVELLVTTVIASTLMTTLLIVVNPTRVFTQQRNSDRTITARKIQDALALYVHERDGANATLESLVQAVVPPCATGSVSIGETDGYLKASKLVPGYLSKIPHDPSVGSDDDTGYSACYDPAEGYCVIPQHYEAIDGTIPEVDCSLAYTAAHNVVIYATPTDGPTATPTLAPGMPTYTPSPAPTFASSPTPTPIGPTPTPIQYGAMRAWIPFSEGSGSTVSSVGNYPLTGTITDDNGWVDDDQRGNAMYFDGTRSITFAGGVASPLSLLDSMSICLWYKGTDDRGSTDFKDQPTLVKRTPPGDGNGNNDWRFNLNYGKPTWVTGHGGGGQLETIASTVAVTDDAWHHVCVTRDGGTGEKVIYLDGGVNISEIQLTNYRIRSDEVTIGANNGSILNNSYLDDIRIFSVALTPTEVATIYTQSQ